MLRRAACLTTLSVLGLLACSSSDDDKKNAAAPTDDELIAEPFPSTIMLDPATVASIAGSDADGTVHFPSTAGNVAAIKKGSVLVGGIGPKTPSGLLRFVYDVVPEGGGIAAKTVYAPPQFAFRKLHVKAKRTLPSFVADGANGKIGPRSLKAQTLHPLTSGHAGNQIGVDVLVFDGDNDESTVDDQLHLTGTLGGTIAYEFGIDFDWDVVKDLPEEIGHCLISIAEAIFGGGALTCAPSNLIPEAKTTLSAEVSANATAKAEGVAYLSFSREYQLDKQTFDPIAIGPLVFFPTAEIDAKIEGGASSRFSVGVEASASAGAGVELSTKTGATVTQPHSEASASVSTSEVVLGAKLKAGVGPRLSLKLYDVAGPTAGFTIYSELDADSASTPCFSQHLGVDAALGIDVSVDLGFLGTLTLAKFEKTFNLTDTVSATGTCALPPAGQSKKLPGQGPDDQTFSTPAFTPYVKDFKGAFGQFPYSAYEGLGWMDSRLSIDGRTLVSGSHFEALTKITDTGDIIWSEKLVWDENFSQFSDRNSSNFRLSRTAIAPDGTILATADPFSIASFEQNGSLRWIKRIDGTDSDDFRRFVDVKADGTGGFWLIGNRGAANDETIGWLLHIDGNGNPISSQTWGDPTTQTYASSLTVVPDGVRVGTWVQSTHEASVLTFNNDGTFRNAVGFTASCGADITPTASAVRPDGGFVIGGVTNALPNHNFFLSFDKTGALTGQTSWGAVEALGACRPIINSLVPLNSTGYLVAGTCDGDSHVSSEVFVGGTDAALKPLWGHAFGFNADMVGKGAEGHASVRVTDDGGALITGYSDQGEDTGQTRLVVAKLFANDAKIIGAKLPLEVQDDPNLGDSGCALTPGTSPFHPVDAPVTVRDLTGHVTVMPVTTSKDDYLP